MLNQKELIEKIKNYNPFLNPETLSKAYNFALNAALAAATRARDRAQEQNRTLNAEIQQQRLTQHRHHVLSDRLRKEKEAVAAQLGASRHQIIALSAAASAQRERADVCRHAIDATKAEAHEALLRAQSDVVAALDTKNMAEKAVSELQRLAAARSCELAMLQRHTRTMMRAQALQRRQIEQLQMQQQTERGS